VLLAAFLVLLVSVSLIAAGVIYGDAVASGGVRRALLGSAPTAQAMLATSVAGAADVSRVDAIVRAELEAAMEPVGGSVSLLVGSGPWVVAGSLPPEEDDEEALVGGPSEAPPVPLVRVAALDDLAAHATLVEGSWPVAGAAPLQASLSTGAAAALGVGVGDRVALVGRTDPDLAVEAVVTGTWRADPTDPFWFEDPLLLEGVVEAGSFTTLGPLVLDRSDLLAAAAVPQLDVAWRAFPALDRLAADEVGALAASTATADERLRAALPPPPAITVTTELPAALAAVGDAVTVSRAGVLILTLEFAVLAGYAIVMVGGMLADRRRGEVALLRSRGAGTGALATMGLLEALLLTVPGVILAPIIGVVLVGLVGAAVGPLAATGAIAAPSVSPAALVATLIAGLGCLVALAAPAVRSAASPAGERAATARPIGRGLAGRLVVDLVLLALAVLALWQLQLYGGVLTRDARGALGVDPLLIAAPALTLLAGALLGTRLLPRAAELLSPIAGRGIGAVVPLATWSIARRPARAARAALLLMLAAALGTFAATYQATWARSQDDQATQAAGADIRAVMSDYPDLPAWAVGPALRGRPGEAAATGVGVRSLDSGRVIRNGTLLAVDADTLIAAMDAAGPGGVTPGTLPAAAVALAAGRSTGGLAIPAEAGGLSVRLGGLRTADMVTGVPIDEPTATVEVVAVLANHDGVHRLSLGALPATPGIGTVTGPLGGPTTAGDLRLAAPARLLALELVVTAGPTEILTGELVVDGVDWTAEGAGDGRATPGGPLPDAGDAGWGWTTQELGGPPRPVEPGPDGGVPVATGDGSIPPILGSPNPPTIFRLQPPAPPAIELPAVASDAFLALTGALPGDPVAATVSGLPVTLRIIDRLAAVPTRAADEPVVVVDAPTLADAELLSIARLAPAREWWLSLDPGAGAGPGAEVAADLRAAPFGATEVVDRADLARTLGGDPVSLGVIGALALGSIAALAMAAVGFLLSVTVAAGERLGEFAVLRALGLSGGSLRRWLLLESAATLAFGLLAGTALGLLLAWLVLPFASLTATGAPPVPAATLVVPWATIGLVVAIGGLALLALTVPVTRRVPSSGLGGVLRAKGDA
jgi:hypothetical protein